MSETYVSRLHISQCHKYMVDRNFSTHIIRFNSYKMLEIEAANLQQEDDLTHR